MGSDCYQPPSGFCPPPVHKRGVEAWPRAQQDARGRCTWAAALLSPHTLHECVSASWRVYSYRPSLRHVFLTAVRRLAKRYEDPFDSKLGRWMTGDHEGWHATHAIAPRR